MYPFWSAVSIGPAGLRARRGRPYTPVASHRQKAAIGYLDRQVFRTPEWMIDQDILFRIEGSGIQDRIRDLQVDALQRLLNVSRMKRQIEQEALAASDAYGLQEMLTDLRRSVWTELDTGSPIDSFRRNLQRGYLDRVQTLLEDETALASDIAPLMRGELRALSRAAEDSRLASPDELTRLHLEDVVARVEEILDPRD